MTNDSVDYGEELLKLGSILKADCVVKEVANDVYSLKEQIDIVLQDAEKISASLGPLKLFVNNLKSCQAVTISLCQQAECIRNELYKECIELLGNREFTYENINDMLKGLKSLKDPCEMFQSDLNKLLQSLQDAQNIADVMMLEATNEEQGPEVQNQCTREEVLSTCTDARMNSIGTWCGEFVTIDLITLSSRFQSWVSDDDEQYENATRLDTLAHRFDEARRLLGIAMKSIQKISVRSDGYPVRISAELWETFSTALRSYHNETEQHTKASANEQEITCMKDEIARMPVYTGADDRRHTSMVGKDRGRLRSSSAPARLHDGPPAAGLNSGGLEADDALPRSELAEDSPLAVQHRQSKSPEPSNRQIELPQTESPTMLNGVSEPHARSNSLQPSSKKLEEVINDVHIIKNQLDTVLRDAEKIPVSFETLEKLLNQLESCQSTTDSLCLQANDIGKLHFEYLTLMKLLAFDREFSHGILKKVTRKLNSLNNLCEKLEANLKILHRGLQKAQRIADRLMKEATTEKPSTSKEASSICTNAKVSSVGAWLGTIGTFGLITLSSSFQNWVSDDNEQNENTTRLDTLAQRFSEAHMLLEIAMESIQKIAERWKGRPIRHSKEFTDAVRSVLKAYQNAAEL